VDYGDETYKLKMNIPEDRSNLQVVKLYSNSSKKELVEKSKKC
jgi:hypothetical protein